MSETLLPSGIGVRSCRGHFHVTCGAGDLIYGPYATEGEAWLQVFEIEKRQAVRDALRGFVAGAAWWEFECAQATMWASDKDRAWEVAKKRYPFTLADQRDLTDEELAEALRESAG
jgi:hypothetical protein